MIKANDLIKDINSEYKKKEIVLNAINGKSYKVTIEQKFKNTKIAKIISEMMIRVNYCKKTDTEFNEILCIFSQIIKEFTDIQFNTYKDIGKTYNNELCVIGALIDLGLLEQIITNFNQDEINKIYETINKHGEFSSKLMGVQIDQKIIDEIGE